MGWFDTTARSEAEIEREIAEEIAFHLEQRTRELVEQGMGVEEARIEAERRFGSPERVRAQCRWVHLGEKIMLQRVQLALNIVLVLAFVGLGIAFWRSRESEARTMETMQTEVRKLSALLEPRAAELASQVPDSLRTKGEMLARFKLLHDLAAAKSLGLELAGLEPSQGRSWMQEGWSQVADPKLRLALLEPFVAGGGHRFAVDILHLAATDPDSQVRERAFASLRTYALQDFTGKPTSIYHEWHEAVSDIELGEVFEVSAERYASRLRAASGPALVAELGLLEGLDLEPARARGSDVVARVWWSGGDDSVKERAKDWLGSDDPALRLAALRFVSHMRLDADFIRIGVAGFLTRQPWESDEVLLAACRALSNCGHVADAWPEDTNSVTALRLLRLCVERDTPEIRSTVGEGVLAPLLRLPPDAGRGSVQWLAQWKQIRKGCSPKMLESDDVRWLDAR